MEDRTTTPGAIPDRTPLTVLAERYERHVNRLTSNRYGLADLAPDEVAGHALAALATQHALAPRNEQVIGSIPIGGSMASPGQAPR